jgi:hypothetical protein
MSYAETLAATLKAAAQETYKATYEAGSNFGRAHSALRNVDDLVEVMSRMIDLAVAAEALHNEADLAVKHLRAALAEAMESSGATTVQSAHHSAHLARKPAFLSIGDNAKIPEQFYVQPPPTLDKRALISAMKDGLVFGDVTLSVPNTMSLVIKTKKETPTP